jgi:hypothetical protein
MSSRPFGLHLKKSQKIIPRPGTVAHPYNPSYSEGGDCEDHNSWQTQSKKLARLYFNK